MEIFCQSKISSCHHSHPWFDITFTLLFHQHFCTVIVIVCMCLPFVSVCVLHELVRNRFWVTLLIMNFIIILCLIIFWLSSFFYLECCCLVNNATCFEWLFLINSNNICFLIFWITSLQNNVILYLVLVRPFLDQCLILIYMN